MGPLIDLTVKDFSDLLASSAPAPGGGSTAALSGALAASLTLMVARLSFGKKSYEALEDEIKSRFRRESEEIEKQKAVLLQLVDKDTEAFTHYMGALKMPAETEEERTGRAKALEQAGLTALEVPLKTAEGCIRILRNQRTIALYGNRNAASDIGVGVLLAFAGLEGAVLNIKINLPGISDEKVKKAALEKAAEFLREAEELRADLMRIVNGRI